MPKIRSFKLLETGISLSTCSQLHKIIRLSATGRTGDAFESRAVSNAVPNGELLFS